MQLRHICEVCGADEVLTPEAAHAAGWDYPPRMGAYGVLSPRICGRCPMAGTVWWAMTFDGFTADMLNPQQRATVNRICGEPESILIPPSGTRE